MKQSASLRLGQQLSMTPALQQAIRLLQMSTLDLQQEIQEALETNLMLEQAEDAPSAEADRDSAADGDVSPDNDDSIPEELPVDAEWEDVFDLPAAGAGASDQQAELQEYRNASLHTEPDLREHLMWQAALYSFTPEESVLANHLIDAINEDGYLEDWEGLHQRLLTLPGVDDPLVMRSLRIIQNFDPPGVAARDLAECLSLQLRQHEAQSSGQTHGSTTSTLALQILAAGALPALADGPSATLARQLNTNLPQLEAALQLIQSLNPKPGGLYAPTDVHYVVPEVFVSKQRGRWRVSLNPEVAPKLRINSYYQSLVRRADRSEEQQTLKQHLTEARYFLNSLRSRNETLLRVARCIVEEQRAFLEYGPEAMKPLILRDISERLGVHESTVSRATAHKYMHTPRGIFELKYFFSSHVSTTSGGIASATAIQAMIKRLISEEKPEKPHSDSRLVKLLEENGVQVARRTVAKYREAMDIPPSHERKRPA